MCEEKENKKKQEEKIEWERGKVHKIFYIFVSGVILSCSCYVMRGIRRRHLQPLACENFGERSVEYFMGKRQHYEHVIARNLSFLRMEIHKKGLLPKTKTNKNMYKSNTTIIHVPSEISMKN